VREAAFFGSNAACLRERFVGLVDFLEDCAAARTRDVFEKFGRDGRADPTKKRAMSLRSRIPRKTFWRALWEGFFAIIPHEVKFLLSTEEKFQHATGLKTRHYGEGPGHSRFIVFFILIVTGPREKNP